MKQFYALLRARNLEFIRDRGSLIWTFAFPVLIIIGCAIAFAQPDNTVVRIGISGDIERLEALPLLQQDFVEVVAYGDRDTALDRVRHHQIDMLLVADDAIRYWVNGESAKGRAAVALLHAANSDAAPDIDGDQLSGQRIRYVDWVMPGVLAMNMMFSSLFGVGYVLVRYRQNGVLKRMQATPITPFTFLCAQLASRLLIVVAVNATIFIGCNVLLDILVLGSYLNLLLIAVLGALALTSLGLLVASRTASEEFAGGLLNACTWPMMIFSQVWFSLDNAPLWVANFAQLLPLTHVVSAGRAVMLEGAGLPDIGGHLSVLAIMTAVLLALAARLFRWQHD